MGTKFTSQKGGQSANFRGQTVRCIKMPLGMEVGFSPGDFVLYEDSAPLAKKGAESPIIRPFLLWPNGCMHQDATWYGGRPLPTQHCVRWGPSPLSQKGRSPTQFSVHVYCGQTAAWIKMPLGTEVGLGLPRPRPTQHCVRCGPSYIQKKGTPMPPILASVYCGQMAGWIKMPLGTEVNVGSGDVVLDGDQVHIPKRGTKRQFSWPNS